MLLVRNWPKTWGIGAKETDNSLRTTIDKLASRLERAGTRVVACFNYTGTPYIGQTVLPEVVYAYGLSDAIANEYLKKADLHGYSNTKSEEFLRIAIDDFFAKTEGLHPEGLLPKMAIFATTIDEVRNELQPLVAKILEEKGLPADSILVNLGDDKTTNDDIREFIRLDTTGSKKAVYSACEQGAGRMELSLVVQRGNVSHSKVESFCPSSNNALLPRNR